MLILINDMGVRKDNICPAGTRCLRPLHKGAINHATPSRADAVRDAILADGQK